MLAVSNSTALIHVSRVTFLTWFFRLFDRLVISKEVYNEVVIAGAGMPGSKDVKEAVEQNQIEVEAVSDSSVPNTLRNSYGLDAGEAEVIALALELGAGIAIIDEEKAWLVAKQFKDCFTTWALPFVLDEAEQKGFVNSAVDALRELRVRGKYNPARLPFKCWCKKHGWN